METYIPARPFTAHSTFVQDREMALGSLDRSAIDPPIRSLVNSINMRPELFSLQCCHGHFVTEDGREPASTGEGAESDSFIYRIAYLAVCIADSEAGREAKERLANLPARIDPENVQFGSATWFWDQWPNSYVVQVMPERYQDLDKVRLACTEAGEVEKIRDEFFVALDKLWGHNI